MKLVIAAEIFFPDIGGPATYVTRLIPELLKEGWKVQVITYSDSPILSYEEKDGYQVVRIPRQKNIFSRYFNYLKNLLKLVRGADLIYAQGPIASGLPSLIVKWLRRKKVVMKIVGDVAWERAKNRFGIKELTDEFQKKRYDIKIEFNRWLEHFIVRRMNRIITPSYYLKKLVSGWGASPKKIQVIYNSLEEIKSDLTKEEAKKALSLAGRILLSIGRLAPWKGFDTLIGLIPKFLERFPDIKLIIVGAGPEKENLKFKIKNLKLSENVIMVGAVPHQETGLYFRAADLFVLNTGYEGLSHVLLEALSMKLPAVVSNIGGNPEVIEDGVNGYLFEYNDKEEIIKKVNQLLDSPEKQKQFVEAGLKKLEQFTFVRMIDDTKEVLKLMSK